MWFIIGIVIGALLFGLAVWMRKKNTSLTWYEWVIGILGFLFLLFTIQNFAASFVEVEPAAAWMFLLVTGLPAIILLAIVCSLVWRRKRAAA